MTLRLYQVDAFTGKLFKGNPAAVCPLDDWLPDELMQKIAAENNLAETAFYIPKGDGYELRWFTPSSEVDLCGHATLATAHVMYTEEMFQGNVITFQTRGGMLNVSRNNDGYVMNFPAHEPVKTDTTEELINAIHATPLETFIGNNTLMTVLSSEDELTALHPDIQRIKKLHPHGLIITAKGTSADFVSRCFFPNYGIDEDPVTGSAHTVMAPYWSARLKKDELVARQLSKRGGEMVCRMKGNRVELEGQAVMYLRGEISVE